MRELIAGLIALFLASTVGLAASEVEAFKGCSLVVTEWGESLIAPFEAARLRDG